MAAAVTSVQAMYTHRGVTCGHVIRGAGREGMVFIPRVNPPEDFYLHGEEIGWMPSLPSRCRRRKRAAATTCLKAEGAPKRGHAAAPSTAQRWARGRESWAYLRQNDAAFLQRRQLLHVRRT